MNAPTRRVAYRCCDFAFGNASKPLLSQRRTFTSSQVLLKTVLPTFAPTSSPELDNILSQLRRTIFVPGCLNKEQRKLVFGEKNKAKLESDPVTVTIGDQEVQLEHINHTKHLDDLYKSMVTLLKLMKDRQDWSNVPSILEGLQLAKRNLTRKIRRLLIKEAAAAGQLDVVLDCAKRVSTTGFLLDNADTIATLAGSIQKMTIDGNWGPVDKALRYTEELDELIQSENHQGKNSPQRQRSLRNCLANTGRLLQLAAVRAQRHHRGKDVDGKVARYAKDVLRADFKLGGVTDGLRNYASRPTRFIEVATAVHGLRVAQDILDPSSAVGTELAAKLNEVEPLLEAQYKELLQGVAEGGRGFDKLATELYEKWELNGAKSETKTAAA